MLILILGKEGNLGVHSSLEMPTECEYDAILSELYEKKESLTEIINDIKTSKLPVKTSIYLYSKNDLNDRISLYKKIEKKFEHISFTN